MSSRKTGWSIGAEQQSSCLELWKPELCFKLSWKGDQSKASVDKYLTWPWSIIISGLSEKLSDGVWAGKCDHAVWESRHWHLHHGLQVCWWLKMKWFYFHLSQYVKIHLFCSLSIDGLLTTEHWVHYLILYILVTILI